MARFFKSREANKGQSPGALIFIGNKKVDKLRIRVIDYDPENLLEDKIEDVASGKNFIDTNTVTWINVDGVHDADTIKKIGDTFDLHPLVMEDIMNTGQRAKVEDYDNCLFIVLKMLQYDKEGGRIISEQLSLVLGKTFLLTFQEQPGDVFEPVRERIRNGKGRIRVSGIDYLAYVLLDTVVDNYIYLIETLGDEIESIEDEIISNPPPEIIEKINSNKKEINFLRRLIKPARDMVIHLIKVDSEIINEKTQPFLRDLLDLITLATEAIETYREILTDQLDIYNSAVSNRMNDIMKVLTIFAAIFIPLTFVAGIYGTNFDYLPELHFKYSYFILWGVMITMASGMLIYFKIKKWF